MFNLIHADLYSLRKSNAVRIAFCITCLTAAAMVIISYFMAKGSISSEISGNASALCDPMVMSMVGSLIAGIFICGDFQNKTIHDAIAGGCGRSTVLISKAISYFIVIAVMLLPYAIATVIAFATGSEFMPYLYTAFFDILANASGMDLTAEVFLKITAISVTLMIVYAAQLSICVLFSFLLKRPTLVVALGIGSIMLITMVMGLGDDFEIIESILSLTPFAMNYPTISMEAAAGDLIKAISSSLGFILLILGVTYAGFRKAEIK